MIRITSLTIAEFRGIRHLDIAPDGKNFAVSGPNGTGKSGVVDAIEFALTGSVSRLSGEGQGDVCLKAHGPHVDCRNAPEKASVSITVVVPGVREPVVIVRNVKTPAAPHIAPNIPLALEAAAHLQRHPEIVLSRRQLIRYVLATPGKRAEEVQALLNLKQVEDVRTRLQRIANSADKLVLTLQSAAADAHGNLRQALEVSELSKEIVLRAVNARRTVLGLATLDEFSETTSLKDGLATTPSGATALTIVKSQVTKDIKALRAALAELTEANTVAAVADIRRLLEALARDPVLKSAVVRERFLRDGVGLIDEPFCPFCDTEWDTAALKAHISAKQARLKDVLKTREDLEARLVPVRRLLDRVPALVATVTQHAARAVPPRPMLVVTGFSAACSARAKKLADLGALEEALGVLGEWIVVPQVVADAIDEFEQLVNALPEPNQQDAAKAWLVIAQERLEVYRAAKRKEKASLEKAIRARAISDAYVAVSDGVLTGLYTQVEKEFARLYARIHREDEKAFEAQLTPSLGKLGFNVDFYGRGFFPPGAYHSEGHQDSMGLCLYLALMRHIHGASFTFAVLDDVLMSVDVGHRREVCALLREEFPATQFIMTTHDSVWLKNMKVERLIGPRDEVQFRRWDVDNGPSLWLGRDVWSEIDEDVRNNDIRSGAATLRNYLEFMAAELCHRLAAPVAFRADAQYQLGELLPQAVARMKTLLKKAKDAANSWSQKDVLAQVEQREQSFATLAQKADVERWQVNALVHYNAWANMGAADFAPVVKAQRELLDGFNCSKCGEILSLTPERETPKVVRCECGASNMNLIKK